MAKISDNSGENKLLKLFNRNLGSDFKKAEKSKKAETDIEPQAVLSRSSAHAKYNSLADKAGVNQQPIYSAAGLSINQRAQRRKQIAEARKQQNIENIMALALDYCSESAATGDVDPDWFNRFILLAEDISSPAMQELWGKILAGEITRPGTFSYKSLNTLKEMTNKEAIAFQHACNLSCINKVDGSNLIIYGYYKQPKFFEVFKSNATSSVNLSKFSLPYPEILTLMDIELIYRSEIESGELDKGDSIEYSYVGKPFKLTAKRGGIALNYFKLTQTGNELAKLLRIAGNENYIQEIKSLLQQDFTLEDS